MKSIDCVALGEALIDTVLTKEGPLEKVGGSPSNLIINLSQLGHTVRLISAIGEDEAGQKITSTLKDYDVPTDTLFLRPHPTSRVVIDQSITTPTPSFRRGADIDIPVNAHHRALIQSASIFHFTYWPLSSDPAKSTVLSYIEAAKAYGTLISFDPNYHPDLKTTTAISDSEFDGVLSALDIIKPSLDDAKRMFNISTDAHGYMDRFEAYGIPLIILTLGSDGVLISHHQERTHYPATAVDIIDATGAGDAFMAGYLSKVLTKASQDEAVAFAQSISAQALRTIGAITPLESMKGSS
mgnify:CR=1 FL=1